MLPPKDRATVALNSLESSNARLKGLHLHARHKEIMIEALKYYIERVDTDNAR